MDFLGYSSTEDVDSVDKAVKQLEGLLTQYGSQVDRHAFNMIKGLIPKQDSTTPGDMCLKIGGMYFKVVVSPFIPSGWVVMGNGEKCVTFNLGKDIDINPDVTNKVWANETTPRA